jgi:Domain of Unknown Function (DUF1206)
VSTVESGANSVKRAAGNPALKLLERLGYVVRGALYVAMGFLALRLALQQPGGAATDLSGSLVYLISHPFGKLILFVIIIGLAAYSIWGLIRAVFDPLHRGSDASGYLERLGFVTSAVSYGAIVIFGLNILVGAGGTANDSTQKSISSLMNHPAGGALTLLLGLVAIGIAIGQFVDAYRAGFKNDLKGAEMSQTERNVATALGRFGMFARGVIFLVIGWFIVQAGIQHDPSQVQGFGGAFLFLLAKPYGHLILGIVALGFVALGLHSWACARWIRLLGSSA